MNWTLIEPPASLPVTIARETLFARIDGNTYELDTVADLIETATARLDGPKGFLRHALMTQTWDLILDEFPADGGNLEIPLPPVQSVASVKYLDADGAEQTFSSALYRFVSGRFCGIVSLLPDASWPETIDGPGAVTVRFTAGYETVPAEIRSEIVAMAADWFDNRNRVGELLAGARDRLKAYRRVPFA